MPAAPAAAITPTAAAAISASAIHYLLEPGWRADAAIQGLGRSNRTNQKQPPVFRPVATDVKGEKRFLSTIARRLDTLGAITRGQRQTGGQGLFRADDNLESPYAKAALRQFYQLLHAGKIDGCSLAEFRGRNRARSLPTRTARCARNCRRSRSSSIASWRLRIDLQNTLFAAFEQLLEARIEAAIAAGTYDIGVETLIAESFTVADRRTLCTHAATGAETRCYRVLRKNRNQPLSLRRGACFARHAGPACSSTSSRAAPRCRLHASSLMHDDGRVIARTRLSGRCTRETVTCERIRAFPLARRRPSKNFSRSGKPNAPRPGIFREQLSHRHRPAAADLGPAAGRRHAGLPLRDR